MTCRLPRYFCTPQWNHMTLAFTDKELKTLARAAVRPLEKRGKPYLYNEGKMIKAHLFPQISACRKRPPPEDDSDGSAPEDPLEGDDEEGVPDYMPEETHGPDMITCSTKAVGDPEGLGASRTAANQDNQAGPSKGKDKVGHPSEPKQATVPGGSNSPHFAANTPSVTSQGLEAAGGHSGVAAPKILTSAEPNPTVSEILTLVNPTPTPGEGNVKVRQPGKRKASFSSGRPYPKIPRVVAYVDSSLDDEGEGSVGRDESVTLPTDQIKDSVGGSTDFPLATSSAELPETSAGGLGSSPQTDDPTPETMLRAMASGRAYIREDHWSHFRTGTVSDQLCNFFNRASYAGEAQAERIRRLEAQLKESEDHRSRAELSCQEEARSSQVLLDQCLARQVEAEQRASSAAEEVKTLQDQLSSTQEALLRSEQNAEDAKSSYECRIDDLERQALTVKSLLKEARLELEIQSVDHFKRSPAYDVLLLREFPRGMVSAREFFNQKNRAVRLIISVGINSISKRVLLVMFSGLEHVLIQCLIEFRSFRLLIHKVSSPNVLTMPLYVLLRCVDFIDDFRDDFSTVFQSCIVVFVCERVTVRNPKTDSNSEFGRSRYGLTNRECAGEDSPGRGPHGLAVVEAVGPTAWSPFCSRVGHAPPTAWG
ncbi:hypothetical protein LWI29_022147 [Acer saccharum]|uniref:Uncharacterized protein n=1 Tax=Acer saccharum TaxID=4024 RepID=A0AA39RSG8_ACESA|nr:hypothetical protein LWI29_022147 [Acer saccharum]